MEGSTIAEDATQEGGTVALNVTSRLLHGTLSILRPHTKESSKKFRKEKFSFGNYIFNGIGGYYGGFDSCRGCDSGGGDCGGECDF